MPFVTAMFRPKHFLAVLPVVAIFLQARAQINAPYSRYGLGDLYNARNVANKGMGNLSTAFADYQSVNFVNPASYSQLQTVTFDVGLETEMRSLVNPNRTLRNNSGYLMVNYVAVGMPLAKDKKEYTKWGLAFGLHPYSRVNYNILSSERLPGLDSVQTFYKGSGGGYRAFLGTGYRIGNLSIGVNAGFLFGQQDLNTQRNFINDSIFRFNALQQVITTYRKFRLDAGFQYKIKFSKEVFARIAGNGFLGQQLNANQSRLLQTYLSNPTRGIDSVDVVQRFPELRGSIQMPAGFSVGLMLERDLHWMFGAEYEQVKWSDFRFFGKPDLLANTRMLRVGGSFIPSPNDAKSYFSRVTYRAGFFTGTDMVVAKGVQLPVRGITVGFGLPIRRFNIYSNQFSTIHTSFEYGSRGNKSVPVTDNFFRVNVGFSLGDIWFRKRRFD